MSETSMQDLCERCECPLKEHEINGMEEPMSDEERARREEAVIDGKTWQGVYCPEDED